MMSFHCLVFGNHNVLRNERATCRRYNLLKVIHKSRVNDKAESGTIQGAARRQPALAPRSTK